MPHRVDRQRRAVILVGSCLILVLTGLPVATSTAAAWTLALREHVTLPPRTITLADLVSRPIPNPAGDTVLAGSGEPGGQLVITRRLVLRRLVEEQLAEGVRFTGAESCWVRFGGQQLETSEISGRIQNLLADWLPAPAPGAPPTWCEVTPPDDKLAVTPGWQITLLRPRPLEPGRNLLTVKVMDGTRAIRLNVTAICHCYGQIPTAVQNIAQDTPLTQDHFRWEWTDLAQVPHGVVCGRESLAGQSARRAVAAGALLRQSDLRETPLVRRGQKVDLRICRQGVTVTVRATARQDGCHGKLITVRNELSGELTTGRVTGPGLVEWGR